MSLFCKAESLLSDEQLFEEILLLENSPVMQRLEALIKETVRRQNGQELGEFRRARRKQ